MKYTHVLNRGPMGIISPLDRLNGRSRARPVTDAWSADELAPGRIRGLLQAPFGSDPLSGQVPDDSDE